MGFSLSQLFDAKMRAAVSHAKARVSEANKLLPRAKRSVAMEHQNAVRAAVSAVLVARTTQSAATIERAAAHLGELTDKHLHALRKAPWRESAESIVFAVLVALILRSFVVEAFKIPSGSMIPTLAIGDQIFVNKLIYGPRVPFTSIRLINFALPKRGDIIVFICPEPPNEDYIKRVVGLPGDEVTVRGGVVHINGEPVARAPLGQVSHWDRDSRGEVWHPFAAAAYKESLGDHTFVSLQDADMLRGAADFRPFIVPPDHVFMMGDNRDHSYDSRSWGPVPVNNILGRAMFVWWSWGREGVDTSRIGTWLE